ncbi:quinon protein alcohol dehydrogenase-like superfamily [Cantharellus anzutake]|uniref:quinon protein alcohol dehydrogenase-like superfamily n=1 Tax=Cantharellus anzutake TaxID=1750568 RepID=UPI0019047A10|nr:quinon protein alcohol dehydrogenase-like superfamily [Cantharellus anzutake]KAF8324849.1 quinon protein alcohol dehydrogenase-like superfamily [Cantharellus anzutake]
MKASFKFLNLCGSVYKQGNIVFTPDGNSVFSAVGNRISVFDLVNNKSFTFPFQNQRDIAAIALSPDGKTLISVDEIGKAIFVNVKKAVVLHRINLKKPVKCVAFSPDGKYFAVTHGAHVQVWKTPNLFVREFAPFELHHTYREHNDDVLSITWSDDSRFLLSASRDMTARIHPLEFNQSLYPKMLSSHRDAVVSAYFANGNKEIYTITRDGAVVVWRGKYDDEDGETLEIPDPEDEDFLLKNRWRLSERYWFDLAKVVSTAYHKRTNMLVAGFSSGVFGLWEMPSFTNIHTLSISQDKISSLTINPSGEWLALGATKLGQLLVWEWQSESYILKQQGHYFDMNTLSFSSDGQHIATGGDDGKVKIWNVNSGFCFVTFSDHASSISSVEFAKQGQVLFTASLDGTVRAFDLIRYRNFRTFTSPTPVQFSSLAVDPSGEVVVAGSADSFEVFMWSVQTGKLLDVLTGHEAPVNALAFAPTGNYLVSGSWDKTVRLWNVFTRTRNVQPFLLNADVLCVAFRPDGLEIAAATLDGQITFWETVDGRQTGLIEGRRDISGGRMQDDRITAANNSVNKYFTSVAYTVDGSCVIAGGNSKYVVMYNVQEGVMLKKFQISENLSLDGAQDFLDYRRMKKEGGDLMYDRGDESDLEDRRNPTLPGAQRGDLSKRRYRQDIRTKCIRFSPTGGSWAAASTEGLLIYSLDEGIVFEPLDLDIDITPQNILEVLSQKEHLKALVMAFRLNEKSLIERVYEAIPSEDIALLVRQLPRIYVPNLLSFVASHAERSPHMEFDLLWINALLGIHGRFLREHSLEHAGVLRAVQKSVMDYQKNIAALCDSNRSSIAYMMDQAKALRLRRQ